MLQARGTVSGSAALLAMTQTEYIVSAIRARMQGVREWVAEMAPYVTSDQRHLDADTPEEAYWNYGYQGRIGL